jgi:uncharacterized protein (DUF305 family)
MSTPPLATLQSEAGNLGEMHMATEMKSRRSHAFILSATGLTFIALVLAINAGGSYANISGIPRAHTAPAGYINHARLRTLFPTGDTDFDYATNMLINHRVAVEMSKAQVRSGRDKALRHMAVRTITGQDHEIAKLDRWMATHIDSKPKALLSSR